MSRPGNDKMKAAAALIRRGATMLAEPCQRCGGVQVRFHGKVYCTSHDDISPLLREERASYDSVVANMRELLISKLNEASLLLEKERDMAKQEQLVSLMARYFDLLQKVSQK
ncbi:MAG: hypothetical protein LYZ69_07730 [Nitrososphaerales archaeon]|nr:hypothetical protein [Nitrososphaerales archaeon]